MIVIQEKNYQTINQATQLRVAYQYGAHRKVTPTGIRGGNGAGKRNQRNRVNKRVDKNRKGYLHSVLCSVVGDKWLELAASINY